MKLLITNEIVKRNLSLVNGRWRAAAGRWRERQLLLFLAAIAVSASAARDAEQPSLTVTNASVPFYPRASRMARIEGTVRLRVTTDGRRVSAVQVESGHAMLAPAAQENVKTWEFEKHTPTSFEVTFRYSLLPESECDMDSGTVLLRLPTQVDVTAKGWKTCDPDITAKPKSRP